MITLGVYVPGEFFTLQELVDDLPVLAAHGVNAVWLTHWTAADTAALAAAAKSHGIVVVAALATLDGSVEWHRQRTDAQVRDLADETAKAWGNSPPPLAWGMCDEPKAAWIEELRGYINSWWKSIAGPVTTVASWSELESASEIGCEFQACFVYPFRWDGSSGY